MKHSWFRKISILLFFIITIAGSFSIAVFDPVKSQIINPVIITNIELVTLEEESFTVSWVTSTEADTVIQWGETEELGEELTINETTQYHIITVDGLEQGTEYYYRIGAGGRWSGIESETTLVPPEGNHRANIAIVADTHYDSNGENTANGNMYADSHHITDSLVNELNSDPSIDFVITLGDLTNGELDDYINYSAVMDKLEMEWYPVLGNWDKQNSNWSVWYEDYFRYDRTYYSIEKYGYSLVVLDSAVEGEIAGSIDEQQLEWFEQTLDDNAGKPVIVFMHHMIDRTDVFGVDQDTKTRLENILSGRKNVLGVYSGHMHKNIVTEDSDGRYLVTVAGTVQYPSGYSIMKLYEEGYTQSFKKIESVLDICEESRMRLKASNVNPNADQEALGDMEDRNFAVTIPVNHPPVLSGIEVSNYVIPPGGKTTVMADASDPDNDTLEYVYETTGGEIIGEGDQVEYLAPSAGGEYEISVKVSDGEFMSDEKTVEINVDPDMVNSPPRIVEVVLGINEVVIGEKVSITVDARDDDGDDIIYHYRAENGVIIGSGSRVEWEAPSTPGDYDIDIWVSDGKLDSAERTVTVKVSDSGDDDGGDDDDGGGDGDDDDGGNSGGGSEDGDDGGATPGFQFFLILGAVFLICLVRIRRE